MPTLDQIIIDSFKYSNLSVITCYRLIFDFKNKFQNIGFIIFSILILTHIPIIIYYCIFNVNSIKKFIFFEMNKFGYWLHSNNPTSKKNKNNNISKMENKKILNNKSSTIIPFTNLI